MLHPSLSINQITTYRWTMLEDVLGYGQAGVEGIGLWRSKLYEFGEERSVDLIRDSGLSVTSLSWAGGFTGVHGHPFAEAVEDALSAIELASRLNAECLVLVSGSRGGHTANHARQLLIDALGALIDAAELHDVTLALQPMHPMFTNDWTFLTTLDETVEIIDYCNHPAIGLAFDVYHLWQEPRLLSRIAALAELTSVVQLNDWHEPPRGEQDRLLPGDGIIPLTEIMRSFLQAGYAGPFEIEIWSDDLWSSDYAELVRQCRERFVKLCRECAAVSNPGH